MAIAAKHRWAGKAELWLDELYYLHAWAALEVFVWLNIFFI
jgi:hypothetical protein